MPHFSGLRSPYELVGGLYHFGRMIDKINLHARGRLPADYHGGLGAGHDRLLCSFLQVAYARLRGHVLEHPMHTDERHLEWAYCRGRRLTPIDHLVFNEFLRKRGWRDEASANLDSWLAEARLPPGYVATVFDYIEHDEGRSPRAVPSSGGTLPAAFSAFR